MIPGSFAEAIGILFILAAMVCWTIAVGSAVRGICDVMGRIRSGDLQQTQSDSGTVAVLFAAGFVLFMYARIAFA